MTFSFDVQTLCVYGEKLLAVLYENVLPFEWHQLPFEYARLLAECAGLWLWRRMHGEG
jgi:hypothetical protein